MLLESSDMLLLNDAYISKVCNTTAVSCQLRRYRILIKMQLSLWLCVSVLLVSLLQDCDSAAGGVELVQPHPDHPNKCYHSSTRKAYAVGEKWYTTKQCVVYTCKNEPDTGYLIETTSCDTPTAQAPCRVVTGTSGAQYPACCSKVECPKKKN